MRTEAERQRERRKDPAFRLREREYPSQYQRFKRYGLTEKAFEAMLTRQGNACKVCRHRFDGSARSRASCHVDHDHETKRVRGLLCSFCNKALGFAEDSAARLRLLAQYLENAK